MKWAVDFLTSSIGKKLLMAATGLSFCGFLTTHLVGNLTIYGGSGYLNAYSEKLHSLGPVITAAELGLLSFALVHVFTGTLLFFQNLKARPDRYAVKKSAGGKTLSSTLMPYTGYVILTFVIIHLLNFHFVEKPDGDLFKLVTGILTRPGYIAFYVFAMAVVGLHVRHGFWSAFQSFGLNHPKYMPAIQVISVLFAIGLAVGFGSLPVFILLSA